MAVVEGNANAIKALGNHVSTFAHNQLNVDKTYQALEVRSICIRKEVVDQAIKEELSLFLAQDLGHSGSVLMFMSGIASNEVLEV